MGRARALTMGVMGGLLWALAGCGGTADVQPDDSATTTNGALSDEDAPPLAPVGAPQVDLAEDAPEGAVAAGPAGGAAGTVADGGACAAAADCASGVCEGKGCDGQGPVCVPARRMCTKDLRPYCGCDGRTFRTSGSCPGRPYAQRGACPAAGPDEDAP